ncbi:MAG: hypothetical protein HY800_05360 [Ignavibacteriales bacterium]|nr:hypothetical protein [Ignavibacteriales bacterium]
MNEQLNSSRLSHLIEDAILEDIGLGDVTTDSIVPNDLLGHGDILVKEPGVIAGLEVASMIFQYIDPDLRFKQFTKDGSYIEESKIAATVDGPFASILKTERTVLNILQRMSGIATIPTFDKRGTQVKSKSKQKISTMSEKSSNRKV